jgi:hypothetical protein
VQVTNELSVKLIPAKTAAVQEPLLCGIEVIEQSVVEGVAEAE